MERTGFGGSSRCGRTEVKAKVWVSVDLLSAGESPAAGRYAIKSLSECRSGDEVFIRAVVSDGHRDEEIWGKGRDRAEAIRTGLRRYRLIG
jgi:hypothetical protein